jgi:hypothetical protein
MSIKEVTLHISTCYFKAETKALIRQCKPVVLVISRQSMNFSPLTSVSASSTSVSLIISMDLPSRLGSSRSELNLVVVADASYVLYVSEV